MPSLETARRMARASPGETNGMRLKRASDETMEGTWDNDIQSKVCYVYDHAHDDSPEKAQGMTYERTTKTRIDAKFIVTSYGSISKDQEEFHLQFKPSQPVRFKSGDPMSYFETDYRKKYGVLDWPIGMWVDIPDEKGMYRKWLVCSRADGNQFTKYSVLPANYRLYWIERHGSDRIKRSMWCVLRMQSSYRNVRAYGKTHRKEGPLTAGKPLESRKLQHKDETSLCAKVQKMRELGGRQPSPEQGKAQRSEHYARRTSVRNGGGLNRKYGMALI